MKDLKDSINIFDNNTDSIFPQKTQQQQQHFAHFRVPQKCAFHSRI